MAWRVRLWVGPVAACALDVAATLACQPAAYWAGDRGAAEEANPLGLWVLRQHPWAFAGGAAALLALYVVLIERLPPSLARVASFVILFLHAAGGASWAAREGLVGIVVAAAWLALAAWVLNWSWRGEVK